MLACLGIDFFGKRKTYQEPKTIKPEDTIRELRFHIDRQEKRENYLEHKCEQLAKEAKQKLASGDKRAAVAIMKKRKLYQAEQGKIGNVKMTLETQCINLESAAGTADAFQAMAIGNNTMKKIRQDVGGVDSVDDVMMDMQEEMQMADEVGNAIGQSIDPTMGQFNDDDLMKELDDMENADLETQFNQAETGRAKLNALPNQPSKRTMKEQEDLKQLQAELAM